MHRVGILVQDAFFQVSSIVEVEAFVCAEGWRLGYDANRQATTGLHIFHSEGNCSCCDIVMEAVVVVFGVVGIPATAIYFLFLRVVYNVATTGNRGVASGCGANGAVFRRYKAHKLQSIRQAVRDRGHTAGNIGGDSIRRLFSG